MDQIANIAEMLSPQNAHALLMVACFLPLAAPALVFGLVHLFIGRR